MPSAINFSQLFNFFWATLSDNLSISNSPYSLATVEAIVEAQNH